MRENKYKKNNKQKGAAMLISVVFFLFISLATTAGLVSPSIRELKNSDVNLNSKKSYFLAESGTEDAYYRLLGGFSIDDTEVITLDANSVSTTVTSMGSSGMEIVSTGEAKNHERQLKVTLVEDVGVSFNYGVQVGSGGMHISGSGVLNGNIYANGPITGTSSAQINGTAISANSPSETVAAQNSTGSPTYDVIFGKVSTSQDVAQSFQVLTEEPLGNVKFRAKKIGSPTNATVKIVEDDGGIPGSATIASGIMFSNNMSTSYNWITVNFTSNPVLKVGTTYWMVVDAVSSSSKYYTIMASSDSYANGVAKIGRHSNSNWNDTSPSNLDYYFILSFGGIEGIVTSSAYSASNRLNIDGEAHAHYVTYVDSTGDIYCVGGGGSTKTCISETAHEYEDFPITSDNISSWKSGAASGGTYVGDYSVGSSGDTLGPKKIEGNLSVASGGILTLTGNLWVTGDVTLSGGGKIALSSSYGTDDGVVVTDGQVSFTGGGEATGSGEEGSYLMVLSTYDDFFSPAIDITGGAGAVIAYAPSGIVNISGSASLKEVIGQKISISGSSSLTYESGLTNNNFSSGPAGTWVVGGWGEQ